MDDTDQLLYQLGLLLSQTRFARRTLEDIERETATYGTFAFSSVIAAGTRFGAPPLFDGALRVHIINIDDLGPGSGFGGLIEGLLGGAGRFVSNLFSGFVGGLIATPVLIFMLPTIERIAASVIRILQMIGIAEAKASAAPPAAGSPVAAPPTDKAATRAVPATGSNLVAELKFIEDAVKGLTALLTTSGQGPDAAAKSSNLPSTAEAQSWQKFLETTTTMLRAVAVVANALNILIPTAIGSISLLIYRLADIRLTIAETLQFFLRNLLMLRGVLLTTAYSTLSLVARMAAVTVDLLATTLSGMLSAVFETAKVALMALFTFGGAVGEGIKNTIDALLKWIVPTIDDVLRALGDTPAFRVITHIVRILPAILPPIYELKKEVPLDPTVQSKLTAAASWLIPGPGATPGVTGVPPAPPSPPNVGAIIADPEVRKRANEAMNTLAAAAKEGPAAVGDEGVKGLKTLATRFSEAATKELAASDKALAIDMRAVGATSATLAESVIVPEHADPHTGLEAIAKAYETWLTSGNGLQNLLGTITRYFTSDEGRAGIPQRVVDGSAGGPQTTIQIDEVVIELDAPGPATEHQPPAHPGHRADGFPLPREGDDIERYARMWRDYRTRGGSNELLPSLA